MADDIDIEEHDVLESLRRRHEQPDTIQPDTFIVKSEPLEVEYEESNYEEPNYENQWTWDQDKVEIKIEPREEIENAEAFRFGKIILGSKPVQLPQENDLEAPSGSQVRVEEYNYNMSLVLDDWGPILDRSDCYCKICETLFATVNALDAHKMIAHSFLVATDKQPSPERNKAFKSTAKPSNVVSNDSTCKICHFQFKGTVGRSNLLRHYKNVHRVDPKTIDINSDFKSWRICNHCNLYFPDDTSLVKHLYELLPLNDKTPTKDDKRTVGQPVKPKPVLNVVKNIPKAVKSTSKNPYVTFVNSPNKKEVTSVTPVPNRIILGSKPMVAKSSENEKQPNKIKLTDTKVRFKCLLCNEIFTTEYGVKKHRKKHPTRMKRKRLFVKLVNKTNKVIVNPMVKKEPVNPNLIKKEVKVYPSKAIVKKEVVDEDKGVFVSKSTLFKCNRCSVHFLTCTGACQHSIVCETSSNIGDWACPLCQRVFKSAEKTAHKYQHKMLNTHNFKVYVVYLEMIVRILCQCPNCFVCFEEDKFWRHVNGGCSDAASYYCNECRLPIDIHSKANHDSKHKKGDFTKDDFIKIDYITSKPVGVPKKVTEEIRSPVKVKIESETPRKVLKRKLELPAVPLKRKKGNSHELFLYYCQFCKSYLGSKSDIHKSGRCKVKQKGNKGLCKICGIYFRQAYYLNHMSLHVKNPNLTIADITFFKLADLKKTKPVQVLHACKACKVHFLTKLALRVHKCKETSSTTCQTCQKKIQTDLFDSHMRIHNYVIPREIKSVSDMLEMPSKSQNDTKSPVMKSPLTKLPDLLMKYQSLTALWNILYLCAICDTFTDSYDKVVEHCQNHLTNMENYGVVIRKCDKCDMKFDSECYKRHLELHAENKVSKKTFQILKYEHYNLFSDKWFDFIDLPEEQKSQIVGRSIYGGNRCVKMKLIQQGPPEYTLYKCEKCQNCVIADTIVYHVKLANCCKAHKIPCSICEMSFAIRRDCEEHERIHEATGLGLQSFRIVSFNDASDAEANKTIMSYDTENHGSKNKISFTDAEIVSTAPKLSQNNAPLKSFVFYKCAECQTCVAHMRNFQKHACNNLPKRQCALCGIFHNAKYFSNHQSLHKKYTFSRKNVITKTVNKDGKVINIKKQTPEKKEKSVDNTQSKNDTDQRPKLYKCFCGLHFTSMQAIERHYKAKNCSTVIREKCSQCDLVFDPIEVVNHLCKHHAQNPTKTFNIITPNKKTLYKCGLCHVLFYHKTAAFPHKAKCTGTFCGKKCVKCGLAFDNTSLATHMVDHERNNKLRTDCYVIVKIPDETIPEIERGLHPNILYKCKTCEIHFLRRSSARNHITKRTDCGTTIAEACKICKRKFPAKSILRHVAWQHKKLKIKEFNVRELIFSANSKFSKVVQKEEIKPKVKKEEVVIPDVPVAVTVYRCVKCMLLFTDESTLLTHLEDRCSKELTEECEECNVKFASKNIREHNREHGPGVALSMTIVEDVEAPQTAHFKTERKANQTPFDPKEHPLYKCTSGCNLHYLNKKTLLSHNCETTEVVKCEICDLSFTKKSLCRHKAIHEKHNFKKEDVVILTLSDCVKAPESPDSITTETQDDQTPPNPKNAKKRILDRYDNKLYKCTVCNLHYLTQSTLEKHKECIPNADSKCEVCDIAFTSYSLKRHKLIHEKYNFKKEDFVIVTLTDLDPNWIQRKVQINKKIKKYISLDSGSKLEPKEVLDSNSKPEPKEVLDSSSKQEPKEVLDSSSKQEPKEVLDSSSKLESKEVIGSTEKIEPNKAHKEEPKKDTHAPNITHSLYKCAECNVYFNTRITCHKHIVKHTPLDPKEYIECKLCGFQFTLMGLPSHIKKNHAKSFNLQEVLIEEYKPNDIKTHETYYASEKDQSTLVSTSEDVKNVSNLRKENDCEVSSCNEIAGNVDSSDNSSKQGNIDITSQSQSSNDLEEITEPNSSKVNVTVDSSGNDKTMNTDLADDKTKVNGRVGTNFKDITDPNSNSSGRVESSDNNSTQVNLDADNETKIISNDLNEIAESNLIEDKVTVDSSDKNSVQVESSDNNSTQVDIDAEEKTKVINQDSNFKGITESNSIEDEVTVDPSDKNSVKVESSDNNSPQVNLDADDETKVISNDLNEIAESNSIEDKVTVDSSDKNSVQVESSDNNSTQVDIDSEEKTKVIDRDSNFKGITESNSIEDEVTVDPSDKNSVKDESSDNNSTQVNIDAEDKTSDWSR
ncbi:uncharacterized protein LOC134753376 [Cydia strobilella]|uniref:uncharacterized protein LOC134753376 n=1 Tax=Cydia strobilella TaxID=1100964 RepID=UPI0030046D25